MRIVTPIELKENYSKWYGRDPSRKKATPISLQYCLTKSGYHIVPLLDYVSMVVGVEKRSRMFMGGGKGGYICMLKTICLNSNSKFVFQKQITLVQKVGAQFDCAH